MDSYTHLLSCVFEQLSLTRAKIIP
jgi:hypothetical protein